MDLDEMERQHEQMGPGVVVRNEAPADNSGDSGSGDGKSEDGTDEGEKV
ncbi:hypothetical protein [Rhizobium leguminosarum]